MRSETSALDNALIADLVRPQATVLDLGCGDGDLMEKLVKEKGCRVQGIEADEQAIYACVSRGLSVLHGDIDTDLQEYGDGAFDYVVFNGSLQQVRRPATALQEALRVGRAVIVKIPNFAHWRARSQIFFQGKTPVTASLPYRWHDTPNLHFLSLSDFTDYCAQEGISITAERYTSGEKRVRFWTNLLALSGIYVLEGGSPQARAGALK
jgi:methionine biosynthesis protein MetW